jgi:serine/threonine protein kinase/Tfp pilus assembly protein PilF
VSSTLRSETGGQNDRVERLFEQLLELPQSDRKRVISAECGDDTELAAELLSLLEHAVAGEHFFGRLAHVMTPPVLSSTIADRYELRGVIGTGGMGTVYRAHDTRLDRDVALKFLPPPFIVASDPGKRLLLEARAAAGLEHVNVCTVYEIGETAEGRPFIAMALYEGETLKERLARGPLSAIDAVDIAVQVARGLGAAHAHGVVHRDVKPGNIMLTAGGGVKLLDFGLATRSDAELADGITPGTIPYMSPEQTRGELLGPESDLWSLGVVIYEMLTGVRPFSGNGNLETVEAIRSADPVPLRNRATAASASVERIVTRLLDKQPERRYRDATELVAHLTDEQPALTAPPSPQRVPPSRRMLWAVPLIVVGVTGAAWWGVFHRPSRAVSAAGTVALSNPRTLAILPFANLDRNPDADYLSEGLTQELTKALSAVRSVRVVSRTSASRVDASQQDVRQIGRALKVNTLLIGRLQNSNAGLRINARLVDATTGGELWTKTYEGKSADIATLAREIALRTANVLEAKLSPTERDRLGNTGTRSQEAFSLYLKGRYFANQRTATAYRLAIDYFERAVAADSQYGAPWAGLARIYVAQGMSGQLTPEESRGRARAAALRAVSLDSSLAEAHAALAVYLQSYDWGADRIEREYRLAIDLDPNYATARYNYANFLCSIGRYDEAIAQHMTANELDPLVPAFNESIVFPLLRVGRADEALARVKTALELDSTYWRAHAMLGNVFEAAKRYDDAMREYERANQLAGPAAHRTTVDLARVLALTGRRDDARRLLAVVQAKASATGVYDPSVATTLNTLGDDAAAYAWLERGYAQRHPEIPFIGCDTRYRPMGSDPRFRNLLRRAGPAR